MTLPPNFSFVIQDKLAGSAHPGTGAGLVRTLGELRKAGFGGIISLPETGLDAEVARKAGIEVRHIPIRDFSVPSMEQIRSAVDFINERNEAGEKVLVHCAVGMGRTGTILACYFVSRGRTAEEAIRIVRTLRPGSIEVTLQEAVIRDYERHLKSDGGGGT